MFEKLPDSDRLTLTKLWAEFVASPDTDTAKPVADALGRLGQVAERGPADLAVALKDIVATLAARSAGERGTIFPLLAGLLGGELARALLKASAEVSVALMTSTSPAGPGAQAPPDARPKPQQDDLRHSLDLLPPEKLTKLSDKTPGGRDRLLLEGLDLAAAGQVRVNLVELERRLDDMSDASSMAYLEALLDLASIASSKQPYSSRRRDELARIVTGTAREHIVQQVGFRAAKTQRTETQGLSASNAYAVTYWRTNFADKLGDFLIRLDSLKLVVGNDVLVSNPRVAQMLQTMVDPTMKDKVTAKPVAKILGITVPSKISVLSGLSAYPSIHWDQLLKELGATPTASQLYELFDLGKPVPAADLRFDTWADLMALVTSSGFLRLGKTARGPGDLAPVCAMVEHLVLGLADLGVNRYDPLTANALGSLGRLIDIVVVSEGNPSAALRAVDLMMDEIGIVVAVAGSYNWADYEDVMRQILLKRAPSIEKLIAVDKKIQFNSILVTSGMDALGTALFAALASRGHEQITRSTPKIDYFEVGFLLDKLKQGGTVSPAPDVLLAALNPSTPFDTPDAAALVADVLKGLRERKPGNNPFALILDNTIEVAPESTGGAQLDVVLGGLKDAVADGQLEIFLCKSFQKYASLGTGKVAAGGLTLLSMTGNVNSAYARAELLLQNTALDIARQGEGQLVIHMLKHAHQDELALIRSAASNAKFVNEFCWPINWSDQTQGSDYVDGIPLLLRSVKTATVDELFNKLALIDRRDSFSFLRTSYVGGIPAAGTVVGPFVRINTGHESKGAMVEFFYALGHLAATSADLSQLSVQPVESQLASLDTLALTERYGQNIVASYCALAVQNVRPASAVVPLLIRFFGQEADRVTIETRRYLARRLFELLIASPAPIAPASLGALYSAAVVLPTWELDVIKGKLKAKLVGISDSADAERLRALLG